MASTERQVHRVHAQPLTVQDGLIDLPSLSGTSVEVLRSSILYSPPKNDAVQSISEGYSVVRVCSRFVHNGVLGLTA